MIDVLIWYIALQILCVIGFILGFNIFKSLNFRGFAISKSFSLIIMAILAWFLCNQKLALITYSSISVYLILIFLGILSYFIFTKNKEEIIKFIKENRKYLISIEVTFLISFLVFVLLRSYTPNIEGTEKPLEFVVINSLLRGEYIPPIDAWVSGMPLNYYYLGQLTFCNLIKLTLINPAIAFNLINPTVFALVIIGTYEFIKEITNSKYWALLGTFMTAFMGNLEPVSQILNNGWNPDTFRWWEAGHIINKSFPEFPYWSFLHSDVHAHFLVHPFTIMFLFLILSFIYAGNYLVTIEDFKDKKKFSLNILYCLILGSFMLINSWNYPSAIALTLAGIYIYLNRKDKTKSTISILLKLIPSGLFYILVSYILYLAFYVMYDSPVEGLGLVNPAMRTTTMEFLLLIGVFLFPLCIYISIDSFKALVLNKNIKIQNKILAILIPLIIIGLAFLITKSIVITLSIGILIYLIVKIFLKREPSKELFIYFILFLIFSLILTCEFIFVNDLFIKDLARQNTVAKSYIQILLLLPIATTYIMYMIDKKDYLKGYTKRIYLIVIILLILLASTFLYVGTFVKNNKFKHSYPLLTWHIPTLDGSKYIAVKFNGDYDGIKWIKENATKKDVILEAEGAPYSYFGRVASQTGIPSLINWAGSLNVLRGGGFNSESYKRWDAINKIYKAIDKKDIYKLIDEFKITYIFVGKLERINFTEEELNGFKKDKKRFKKVFEKGNTIIYKVIW